MPKVVAVIPVHLRTQMAIETVRMLRHQTVPVVTILVGDSKIEARIAQEVGCEYIQHPNEPLSDKWQAGVWRAKDLDPDAVLILGSDTWLTPTWCETGLTIMQKGNQVVGCNNLYIMYLVHDRMEIVHVGRRRSKEPAGVGRMISCEGMRKLGWKLFREHKSWHCDGIAMRAIKAAGLRCALMPQHEQALSFKCDFWPDKHPFTGIKAAPGLHLLQGVTGNVDHWLNSTYPGSLEALDRLRRSTWPKSHS